MSSCPVRAACALLLLATACDLPNENQETDSESVIRRSSNSLVITNFGVNDTAPNPLSITFCVQDDGYESSDGTFHEAKNPVPSRWIDYVFEAAEQWEREANVHFDYVPSASNEICDPDEKCTCGNVQLQSNVFFRVVSRGNGFFGGTPAGGEPRLLQVDVKETGDFRALALTHEVGHLLGFMHEHERPDAPSACPIDTSIPVRALTAYDPQSIMHYRAEALPTGCGGRDYHPSFLLTHWDAIGAQCVYGEAGSGNIPKTCDSIVPLGSGLDYVIGSSSVL